MIEISELKQLEPLQTLSEEGLVHLAQLFRRRTCRDRETIFTENTEGRDLYLVAAGTVKITKRAKEGEAQSLAILHAGDFLGMMTLLEGGHHSANATASGDTVLFVLDRKSFDGFIAKFPADAVKILTIFLEEMVASLRRMNEKYIDMVNYMWRWR